MMDPSGGPRQRNPVSGYQQSAITDESGSFGVVEVSQGSCAMCHTRVMSDGSILKAGSR